MTVVTIVPTLSRCDLIRNFERSFTETAPPEAPAVYVVMGADDGTADLIRERASKKKRCKRPYHVVTLEPSHFAKAINAGVSHALRAYPDATTIVLANNDLILQPGWYEAMAEAINARVEIVGAKLLYPHEWEIVGNGFARVAAPEELKDKPRSIQHFGKWFSLDFYPFHVLRGEPETHERAQEPRTFPDVTFALVAIRREVWESLNGLDERYVNGFEDDDFCLRAGDHGAEICVHPGMRAIHLESQSTGQDTQNKDAQWRRFQESWIDSGRIQWPLGILQRWRE